MRRVMLVHAMLSPRDFNTPMIMKAMGDIFGDVFAASMKKATDELNNWVSQVTLSMASLKLPNLKLYSMYQGEGPWPPDRQRSQDGLVVTEWRASSLSEPRTGF